MMNRLNFFFHTFSRFQSKLIFYQIEQSIGKIYGYIKSSFKQVIKFKGESKNPDMNFNRTTSILVIIGHGNFKRFQRKLFNLKE